MPASQPRNDSPRRDRPSGLSGPKRPGLGPERKSSPRLPHFDYTAPYAYSVTLNTVDHQPLLEDADDVLPCVTSLARASDAHDFTVHAFCFMPDHAHLLVEGSEGSSLVKFMKLFKQLSSYQFKERAGRRLWQRSYYDRVLRKEEDLAAAAEYIRGNPARTGLDARHTAYPYVGPRELMEPDGPEGLSLRGRMPMCAGDVPVASEVQR